MTITIHPTSTEDWLAMRSRDMTSTESSALFDVCPYLARFELWHRKRNVEPVSLPESERMRWGTRLQDTIAAGVAEDNGWIIRRMDEYMRDPALGMGASFDFRIQAEPKNDSPDDSLLEIKNVDALQFRDGWIVDGDNIEAPPHIEIQVQHQMAVSGLKKAYIAALVGGNSIKLIERQRDERIISAIKTRIADFWESINENAEPSPDWERDAKTIIAMHAYAEPGSIFDARGNEDFADIVQKYIKSAEIEKAARSDKEKIKAQILARIGEAEKVLGDGWTISAGIVGPKHIEFDRKEFRNFRVNQPRKKK